MMQISAFRRVGLLTSTPVSPQGDVPWDEKDFRYLALTAAGVGSAVLYFYFRDNGREISWKDFVHRYISRGVVRSSWSRALAATELRLWH